VLDGFVAAQPHKVSVTEALTLSDVCGPILKLTRVRDQREENGLEGRRRSSNPRKAAEFIESIIQTFS